MRQFFWLTALVLAALSLSFSVPASAELDLENDPRLKPQIFPDYDPDRQVCALSLPQLKNMPQLPPDSRINRVPAPCSFGWNCAREDMPYVINQLLDTLDPKLFEAASRAPGLGFVLSYKEAGPSYSYYVTDFTGQKTMVNKAKTVVLDKVVRAFMHMDPSVVIFVLDNDGRGAAFALDVKTGAINIYDQSYVYYWPEAPVWGLSVLGGFGGINEMLSPYNYRTHARVFFTAGQGLPPAQKPGFFTEITQPDFPVKDPFIPTKGLPRLDYRQVHFSSKPCR